MNKPPATPTLSGMDTSTFPRHAYHHLMHTLRQNLPPAPPDPAAVIARDRAAIAQVTALCPANAAEAAIAAQAVAANAQAMVTMGHANNPATEPKQALQCIAQAGSMMRHAQGALRILRSMQAERRQREENEAAANRSAWIEYGAAQWMAEALPAPVRTSNDTPDQNPGHCATPHSRETESAAWPGSPTREGPYQNQEHNPEHRYFETEPIIASPPPGPIAEPDAKIDAGATTPHPPGKSVPEEPPWRAHLKASASSTSPTSSPAPSPPTSWG